MTHVATFLLGVSVGFAAAFGTVVGVCVVMDWWSR